MKDFSRRLNIIIVFVVLLALACVVRLVDLQIVKGSQYEEQSNRRLVRAYSIAAPRGEIVDKKNRPLVENRTGYTVQVQKVNISDDELNENLYNTAAIVAEYGDEIESTFPLILNKKTGELEYDFSIEENGGTREVEGVKLNKNAKTSKNKDEQTDSGVTESDREEKEQKKQQEQEKLEEWKKTNKLTDFSSEKQIFEYYKKKYSVSSDYDEKKSMAVTAIRYAMEKARFSEKNPYTLARDIDELAVQKIKEQFMDFPGIGVEIEPVRSFTHGTMAAHILGRTGRIYAEEYAVMKDQGYGMNDIIGKDGLEKVLEPYLKGKDGYKSVEMNRGGIVTEILQSQEPQPGNYARLTLDVDLQSVMEKALKEKILQATGSDGAGAAIAVNPKTGGILAMASYPTYDLSTFNEDYDKLIKSKSKPLINRVLNGTYSPGSTFKPLTSIAALETGVISPDTYITDLGKYTYYPSYQPTCLVYSSSGATHGTINVSQAIGVSCNYFFYDVGRRTGIENIDKYATNFGLGQNTGIELSESTGVLASPEEREKAGGTWYPGDVLQTAIGQSDNLFTPAQLASYVSTILNKGKRYSIHLVDEVLTYGDNNVVYKKEPEILADNPISDATYQAVTDGMRRVVSSGTASSAFASAKYKAAGKTGTAEVPGGADNVLFVGFAPYDDPEIVIAVIIEHGANSGFPAAVAREVFDAYMRIKDGTFKADDKTVDSEKKEEAENAKAISGKANERTNGNAGSSGTSSEKSSNKSKNSGSTSNSPSNQPKGKQPDAEPPKTDSSEGNGTL